jgi:LysM repeat protein
VLSPGQQLIIPKQTAVAAAAPALAPAASKPVAAAAAPASVHIVNRGDTLISIARRNNVPVGELARANNLDQTAKLSLGMKLTVPGSKSAAAAPVAQPVAVAAAPAQPVAAVAAPATRMAAAGGPPQSARLASATTNVVEEKPVVEAASVKPSEATGALPTFRWPVRGKVITSYGAKTNGKSNDGIIEIRKGSSPVDPLQFLNGA